MHNNFYSNQCFSKDKTTTSNNRTRGLILINHIHNEQQKDDKPMTGLQSLGKLDIARTLFPSTVGHIPIELSRYIWYALQRGAGIRREVKSVGYKTISACSRWSGNTYWSDCKIRRLKSDGYFAGESRWSELSPRRYSDRYIDQSKNILKSMLNDDGNDDDCFTGKSCSEPRRFEINLEIRTSCIFGLVSFVLSYCDLKRGRDE